MKKVFIKLTLIIFCCFNTTQALTISQVFQNVTHDANVLIKKIIKTKSIEEFKKYNFKLDEENYYLELNKPEISDFTPMCVKDILEVRYLTLNILSIMLSCATQACIYIDDNKVWADFVEQLYEYLLHVVVKYLIINTNFSPQLKAINNIKDRVEYRAAIYKFLNPTNDETMKKFLDRFYTSFQEKEEEFTEQFDYLSKLVKAKKYIRRDVHKAMRTALFTRPVASRDDDDEEEEGSESDREEYEDEEVMSLAWSSLASFTPFQPEQPNGDFEELLKNFDF